MGLSQHFLACTCVFLSTGTLWVLKNFTPLLHGVQPVEVPLGDCAPNCLQIINKLLPCTFGLLQDFSHDLPPPMSQNLALTSTSITTGYFIFHNTNFLVMVLKSIQPILPLMSFDSSLVLHMEVERLQWKKLILSTGICLRT